MTFYETFDDTFFITVSASFFAFCGLAVRACLRSNCKTISCCCISCERYETDAHELSISSPTFRKPDTIANHL